jgi:putative transposase
LIKPLSFKRHRYPGEVIRYAVWLYFRFILSLRDVEERLAQRVVEARREAIRCWVNKFDQQIAANIRRRRDRPTGRWRLDEVVVTRTAAKPTSKAAACDRGAPWTMRARFSTS